ncbi:hypothetical protein Shyhy01_18350 [Streptomyces hygroscopicus subsp. hygroscopicus]|nr:hypothetical protein Shyhy01_18350 [Streptomyces hygroscopicus subsp. hygroscopicus]
MRGGVPEVYERGQEPADEHRPVLRTPAHSTLPRPGREAVGARLLAGVAVGADRGGHDATPGAAGDERHAFLA